MTPLEHYVEAEKILQGLDGRISAPDLLALDLAEAQVHATLASAPVMHWKGWEDRDETRHWSGEQ